MPESKSELVANLNRLKQVAHEREGPECANSLYNFTKLAWPIIETTDISLNWSIQYICEWLELVSAGLVKQLTLNLPRRMMKSTLVSVMWPAWEWVTYPENRWAFASYSAFLSIKHSKARRDIIGSRWYQSLWGDQVNIRPDRDTSFYYRNYANGEMFSTSVGGTMTGIGGLRLVTDDPLNAKDRNSVAVREAANDWYINSFAPSLDSKVDGAQVVVMQRLHPRDLTGVLLGFDEDEDQTAILFGKTVIERNGWTLIRLPAVAEADEELVFPRSGRRFLRKEGDPLWPDREPLTVLESMRANPEFDFETQWQQLPGNRAGSLFRREWFENRYDQVPQAGVWTLSVDASFKKTGASYVVFTIWVRMGLNNYLVDVVRKRISFTETLTELENILEKYPMIRAKLIEDKGNGSAIIDVMKNHYSGVISANPTDSKVARAASVTPLFMSGHVWLPKSAPWLASYISEMTNFPGGTSDDQVDSTSQALSYLEDAFNRKRKRQPLLVFQGFRR